ncbi:MAG TPA: PA2778 family cysteine peptidase [Burkholderiales bacterium]|nr:PA2778 family cysteine peptidase [Burkholderiales bacterium]
MIRFTEVMGWAESYHFTKPMRTWSHILRGLPAVVALAVAGCAGVPSPTASLTALRARSVELRQVPFFPQQEYQCGPAALAMVLGAAGNSATPEQLAPQVYLPGREGSLQVEMVATARRYGMVSYPVEGGVEALYSEVAAGTPVVVLQNLFLPWIPRWHYAVVVGFDTAREEVVLRSGQDQRLVMSLDAFDRSWEGSGRWGLVVLPPDRLPAPGDAGRYLQAVVALEQARQLGAARTAYATASGVWPENLVAWIGLGNTSYALGDLAQAERAFREATLRQPQYAAAFNNLAHVLAERQRYPEALDAARTAVRLGGPNAAAAQNTLESILAQSARQ